MASYNGELPDYGDLMTVADFKLAAETGGLIDYDGIGLPAKDGKIGSEYIYPSDIAAIPPDATHIVWFNR